MKTNELKRFFIFFHLSQKKKKKKDNISVKIKGF